MHGKRTFILQNTHQKLVFYLPTTKGFMYIKSTESTRIFFVDLHTDMSKIKITSGFYPDDQRDLNMALWRHGLKYSSRVIVNSTSHNFGRLKYKGKEMNIALLAQNKYRRLCRGVRKDIAHNSTVLHCHFPKMVQGKQDGLQNYGLWGDITIAYIINESLTSTEIYYRMV